MTVVISRRKIIEALGYSALNTMVSYASSAQTIGLAPAEPRKFVDIALSDGDQGEAALVPDSEEFRAGPGRVLQSRFPDELSDNKLWWKLDSEEKDDPVWPADDRCIDFEHLLQYKSFTGRFRFSFNDLIFLFERNHFALRPRKSKALFALRGCLVTNDIPSTKWVNSVELECTTPDHKSLRCVLGVCDFDKQVFRLFKGSTVPEVSLMHLYALQRVRCNLLPTGLYHYHVGTHRPSAAHPQPGAFIQSSTPVVLRSPNVLRYDPSDKLALWESSQVFDNIHASYPVKNAAPPAFSSAGCQVVMGHYDNGKPAGPWREFRAAAGLDVNAKRRSGARLETVDDGVQVLYDYVLLTGKEAFLASNRSNAFKKDYFRLRFGSSGEAVKALQSSLGLKPTGIFDADLGIGLRKYQKVRKTLETGIHSLKI